jgi:hypothetical protein
LPIRRRRNVNGTELSGHQVANGRYAVVAGNATVSFPANLDHNIGARDKVTNDNFKRDGFERNFRRIDIDGLCACWQGHGTKEDESADYLQAAFIDVVYPAHRLAAW